MIKIRTLLQFYRGTPNLYKVLHGTTSRIIICGASLHYILISVFLINNTTTVCADNLLLQVSPLKQFRFVSLPLTPHPLSELQHSSVVHQDDNSTFKIIINLLLFYHYQIYLHIP